MKINLKLMENNITKSDLGFVKKFLNKKNIVLTQNTQVKKFEENWSRWLGVKYSTFVNSGSSANFISISILKILNQNKKRNEIIVPPLTWVSDINSIIMNGFKPIFVDINFENLSMNNGEILKKINDKTLAVFLTHAQGFNGLSELLLKTLKIKKIFLIEDVCESHGATFKKKKLGSFGLMSNFSFYYAHHLSTIEGGMVCTNNKKVYEIANMLRSHGMVRESKNLRYEKEIIKKNRNLSQKFIFMYPTLNFRNNEIGATIGLNQLKRLDYNNKLRSKNFKLFVSRLDKSKYFTNFDIEGSCNYAFPIILKTKNLKKRDKFEKKLSKAKIEFRRGNAGGGNQMRQPYLKGIIKVDKRFKNFSKVEHVHFFGYYIGNYPTLKTNKINKLIKFLNSINL